MKSVALLSRYLLVAARENFLKQKTIHDKCKKTGKQYGEGVMQGPVRLREAEDKHKEKPHQN